MLEIEKYQKIQVDLNIYFQKDQKLKKVEVEGRYVSPYFHFIYSERSKIIAPQYYVGFLSSSPFLQQLEISSRLKTIILNCNSNDFYPLPWEITEEIKIGLKSSFVKMCSDDPTLLGNYFYEPSINLYKHPLYENLAKATLLDIEQNYCDEQQLKTICTFFASSLVKYAKGSDSKLARFEEGLRELSFLSLSKEKKLNIQKRKTKPREMCLMQCYYPLDFIVNAYCLEELVKASQVRFSQRIYGYLNPIGFTINRSYFVLDFCYKDILLEKQNYYPFSS